LWSQLIWTPASEPLEALPYECGTADSVEHTWCASASELLAPKCDTVVGLLLHAFLQLHRHPNCISIPVTGRYHSRLPPVGGPRSCDSLLVSTCRLELHATTAELSQPTASHHAERAGVSRPACRHSPSHITQHAPESSRKLAQPLSVAKVAPQGAIFPGPQCRSCSTSSCLPHQPTLWPCSIPGNRQHPQCPQPAALST
jgi:hypothetical protein